MTQFDNVVEALHLTTIRDSPQDKGLDAPCDLAPPAEKTNQITPLASPTGVDQQPIVIGSTTMNTSMEASPHAHVHISKTTTTVEVNPTSTALTRTSRRSNIQSDSKSTTQESNSSISDDKTSQSRSHLKEVHNRTNMLFRVFSDEGMKEMSYHVTDFAGLYPVWPIIEISMVPTGGAKDKRMNLFRKCITALLGEILYVDDTAKIATTLITDNKSHCISSKQTFQPTSLSWGSTS
jgi:hypothetical protein